MVSESRSFTIVMFALGCFMCGMIVNSLWAVYNDTEPPAAHAFERAVSTQVTPDCVGTEGMRTGKDFWGNDLGAGPLAEEDCTVYQTIDATVQSRGYDYTGACEGLDRDDGGSGDTVCDAGDDANLLCRDMLRGEFPSISSRRLSEDLTADGRELRGGHGHAPPTGAADCQNEYVPWVVVTFTDPETSAQLTRCSYHLGTKGDSMTRDWSAVQSNPAVGAHIGVWNVEGREVHCVVGWADRPTLKNFAENSGSTDTGLFPMILLFVFISLCALAMCVRAAVFGSDKEDGDKKGDSDGEGGGASD